MIRTPARYEAVLFDWDDTLCYAEPHRYLHAREVAQHFGRDLSLVEIYHAFIRAGDSTYDDWGRFFQSLPVEIGVEPDQQASFTHAYRVREAYRRYTLFDDVMDLLEHLTKRELRVGIISNNTALDPVVEQLNMAHHFEVVVSPHTYQVAKPHPQIFTQTLAVMGVAPQRALYVGDSYDNDVVGARAAGLTPVLVDRFAVHNAATDADYHVGSLAELATLLDRLLNE